MMCPCPLAAARSLGATIALVLAVASGATACTSHATPGDTGRRELGLADGVMAPDVALGFDGTPGACGSASCSAAQYCFHTCQTFDSGACILPSCRDIPAACGGTLTCGCLGLPDGGTVPTCVVSGSNVYRTGCP